MALRVIQGGLFTTVQDLGRPGYRDRGVPVGGAFDCGSAMIANALLGNLSTDSVLEFTQFGGVYEAETALGLAVAGGPFRVEVQSPSGKFRELGVPSSFGVTLGSRIMVGGAGRGVRGYLAVVGGWKTPFVLGSRSSERRLMTGDRLVADPSATLSRTLPLDRREWVRPIRVRFIDGPDRSPIADLDGQESVVLPDSNRMGIRLDGPSIKLPIDPDRLSAPVATGAIQIAGNLPLILGVAGGTIGGYPHVGHVISADLDILAQVAPGDRVQFKRVSLGDARLIDRAHRESLYRRVVQIRTIGLDRGEN